jgi:outer membrane protein assembly factor BamE (lipoprotein component of BamABCDE complex)
MGHGPKVTQRVSRRLALAGAMALGAMLGGCIGYDGDFDRGYQVDEETLAQIKVGATTKP